MSIFTLSEPTIFSDLNNKENKDNMFARQAIEVESLKYKHFRAVMQYPEMDQMHHLMLAVTKLSENDLGELTPDDAAGISLIIFKAMKGFMELGQKMMGKA